MTFLGALLIVLASGLLGLAIGVAADGYRGSALLVIAVALMLLMLAMWCIRTGS